MNETVHVTTAGGSFPPYQRGDIVRIGRFYARVLDANQTTLTVHIRSAWYWRAFYGTVDGIAHAWRTIRGWLSVPEGDAP